MLAAIFLLEDEDKADIFLGIEDSIARDEWLSRHVAIWQKHNTADY